MSRVFPKLAKAITVAAKESGPDPETNSKLRTAIQNAKAKNMPKDNIENAIKRALGNDAADYTELTYEGKGPHGVLVVVECATDNTTRTVANIKSYFNKAGGAVVTSGSLDFMFDRRAVFEFDMPEGQDPEELEMELIDAGLEELVDEEGQYMAYGDFTSFGSMQAKFEELGIECKNSALKRLPTSPVEFSDDQLEEIEKMLDKMEDDDDVQAVFTNIA